jgi:hypothetical protein
MKFLIYYLTFFTVILLSTFFFSVVFYNGLTPLCKSNSSLNNDVFGYVGLKPVESNTFPITQESWGFTCPGLRFPGFLLNNTTFTDYNLSYIKTLQSNKKFILHDTTKFIQIDNGFYNITMKNIFDSNMDYIFNNYIGKDASDVIHFLLSQDKNYYENVIGCMKNLYLVGFDNSECFVSITFYFTVIVISFLGSGIISVGVFFGFYETIYVTDLKSSIYTDLEKYYQIPETLVCLDLYGKKSFDTLDCLLEAKTKIFLLVNIDSDSESEMLKKFDLNVEDFTKVFIGQSYIKIYAGETGTILQQTPFILLESDKSYDWNLFLLEFFSKNIPETKIEKELTLTIKSYFPDPFQYVIFSDEQVDPDFVQFIPKINDVLFQNDNISSVNVIHQNFSISQTLTYIVSVFLENSIEKNGCIKFYKRVEMRNPKKTLNLLKKSTLQKSRRETHEQNVFIYILLNFPISLAFYYLFYKMFFSFDYGILLSVLLITLLTQSILVARKMGTGNTFTFISLLLILFAPITIFLITLMPRRQESSLIKIQ